VPDNPDYVTVTDEVVITGSITGPTVTATTPIPPPEPEPDYMFLAIGVAAVIIVGFVMLKRRSEY
jgi:hypothetical protein